MENIMKKLVQKENFEKEKRMIMVFCVVLHKLLNKDFEQISVKKNFKLK